MNPLPPLPTVSSASHVRHAALSGRGWRWWLAPRPVTTISSVFSLLISAILLAGADGRTWPWRTLGAIGAIGIRAEQLLADLETSHAHLQTSAAEALAATEERHRLANTIHRGLERVLANVNERLEQALVLRAGAPSAADQAVRDAKQSASCGAGVRAADDSTVVVRHRGRCARVGPA